MSVVAVLGDGCTTTAVGLAAAWPVDDPCVVAELDPAGGCLTAWLDLPRSPGLAEVVASSDCSWPTIQHRLQRSSTGLEVLVSPTGAVEAAAVVQAASRSVLPVLSALESPVVIADGGRLRGGLSTLASSCGVAVIPHRQHPGSAAAAALGLERVAELVALLSARSIPTVVALVGQRPYAVVDVADFVDADTVAVADDPWAAAVLAGRAGSASRFRRSPLMRSMAELAGIVAAQLRNPVVASLVEGRR